MKWNLKKIIAFVVIDTIVIIGVVMYITTSNNSSKIKNSLKRPSILLTDVSSTKKIDLDTSANTIIAFVTPTCNSCKDILGEISNNSMSYLQFNLVFIMPTSISQIQSVKSTYPNLLKLNSYFISDSSMAIQSHFKVASYPTSFLYKADSLISKIAGGFETSYVEQSFMHQAK